MKKLFLLTKTLLVATVLLMGGANSAWGLEKNFAIDLSKFSGNQFSYSDGVATFTSSGSKVWDKLDLQEYFDQLGSEATITNVTLTFTQNIGDDGRMEFGVFGNNKSSWATNGYEDKVNSISIWGRIGSGDSGKRLYYGSTNTYSIVLGSEVKVTMTMDFSTHKFTWTDGTKTLSSSDFVDATISYPRYFATYSWYTGNTSTLTNMSMTVTFNLESYATRATTAKTTYTSINGSVMNPTEKSALDAAYTALTTNYDTDEKIVANISGYISAIEALETANENAETSADNFAILNELIANANTFAGTVTEYSAPSGAATVYTENADVDPVSLATAIRNEIARAGVEHGNNTDISAIIVNKGFEMGSILGWNVDGDPATGGSDIDNNGGLVTTGDGNLISGTYTYYTGWNGRNINQTISGLPAGNYKLTAKAKSWTSGEWRCTIALVANGGASTPVSMEGSNTDLEYEFTVLGSETSINIGIAGTNGASSPYPTGGTWGYFCDDFTLTYVGQDPVALAKASLEAEIETATALKDSWTPKVGTAPFKYDATYYNALITQITSATTVLNSGSETVSDYTTAESALETAESNMASSTQNTPDPDKYYQIFVANNDGTASDYNLYMLYERTKTQVKVSATPYPVKFEAITSGTYKGRYYIKTPYSHSLCCDATNQTTAYVSGAEDVSTRLAEIVISLQDNGTIKIYGTKSGDQYKYAASASEGAGVTATTSNTGTWVVSDPVDVTDVNLAVNATTGWGTFIAPYDNLTPSTVKAYTVSHKEEGSIYFTENETGVLSANTPYILSTEEVSNVSVAFKGIANNDENTYKVNGLVGLLAAETVPANSYILQYQAEKVGTAFYKLASNMTGTKYRCYLDLDNVPVINNARTATRMSIYGGITGVENVEVSAENALKDGKYLENGKIAIYKNGVKYNAAGAKLY